MEENMSKTEMPKMIPFTSLPGVAEGMEKAAQSLAERIIAHDPVVESELIERSLFGKMRTNFWIITRALEIMAACRDAREDFCRDTGFMGGEEGLVAALPALKPDRCRAKTETGPEKSREDQARLSRWTKFDPLKQEPPVE
jgi:hypothetical protein